MESRQDDAIALFDGPASAPESLDPAPILRPYRLRAVQGLGSGEDLQRTAWIVAANDLQAATDSAGMVRASDGGANRKAVLPSSDAHREDDSHYEHPQRLRLFN